MDFEPLSAYIVFMTDEAKKTENPTPIPTLAPGPDYEMNTISPDSSKVMTIAMIVILAVAVIGGVIAITPKVKDLAGQKEKIADLEAELAATKASQRDTAPSQNELTAVEAKMGELTEQAKQLQATIASGDVQGKLTQLEGKFNQVVQQSHALGLSGMLAKVQALQQSPEGAQLVSGIVGSLAETPANKDVGQNFENLRASDPNVAALTEGVAPEDMKAAAMLIAMAQMRSSLQRSNDSFDEDLALLKRTLPSDDPALAAAIDRLAPQAKYGVLTPDGLSKEFRGLSGDIVSASLSGSDISVTDKAKARLADVFLVEKNGQRVSGTESQIAIAAAQKQLDAGNVQGAVDILKTLDGPAAEKTQPFLEKAQATLMAGDLQGVLSQSVVQNVKAGISSMVHGSAPGIVNPYGVPALTNKIKAYIPGQPTILTPAE